ncbi:type II toxin-antitoxin system VapC family toxin [Thiocapsa roseopersicina]|uniref:PIN domain-containing protein n=1 Tax=Thiocapsa roseopersicina TaxID=1058 RepID=A0A1H3B5K8_THIRO|nr:type II toxin-antitoxin system VapC family toxin [Thiocapsa roseopersicina]SDX37246.1 PIN domain-containing protein [Thiocapsa roseopersicina]
MKSRVYIETSVISYLAARPSRDLIVAAHQQISQEWWLVRHEWELSISALVISESRAGDANAARRRLELLDGLPTLHLTNDALELAQRLLAGAALPERAKEDALHIAVAAVHGADYLLTWNCKHIANASKRPLIEAICEAAGYQPPIICTPEELLGDRYVD